MTSMPWDPVEREGGRETTHGVLHQLQQLVSVKVDPSEGQRWLGDVRALAVKLGLGSDEGRQQLRKRLEQGQRRADELSRSLEEAYATSDGVVAAINQEAEQRLQLVAKAAEQDETLAELNAARIQEQNRYEQLRQRAAEERHRWERERDDALQEARAEAEAKQQAMERQLRSRLEILQRGAEKLEGELAVLTDAWQQCKAETSSRTKEMEGWIGKSSQEIVAAVASHQKQGKKQVLQAQAEVDALEARVQGENERRERANAQWRERVATAEQEAAEAQERLETEARELDAHLQQINRDLAQTRQQRVHKRAETEQQMGELSKKLQTILARASDHDHEQARLEEGIQQSRGEIQAVDAELKKLRSDLQEKDDALARAVAENEAGREEMEYQRQQHHQEQQQKLTEIREGAEDQMSRIRTRMEADTESYRDGLRKRETKLIEVTSSLDVMRYRLKATENECQWLSQEVSSVKAQAEIAQREAQEVEGEFKSRQSSWEAERMTLEKALEDRQEKLAQLHHQVAETKEQDSETRQAWATRQAELEGRLAEQESNLAEVHARLDEAKKYVALKSELSEERAKLAQLETALEQARCQDQIALKKMEDQFKEEERNLAWELEHTRREKQQLEAQAAMLQETAQHSIGLASRSHSRRESYSGDAYRRSGGYEAPLRDSFERSSARDNGYRSSSTSSYQRKPFQNIENVPDVPRKGATRSPRASTEQGSVHNSSDYLQRARSPVDLSGSRFQPDLSYRARSPPAAAERPASHHADYSRGGARSPRRSELSAQLDSQIERLSRRADELREHVTPRQRALQN